MTSIFDSWHAHRVFRAKSYLSIPLCIFGILAFYALPATAQSSSDKGATNVGGIETVVVTAEKRPEDMQRVPITITAITAQDASAQGITNTIDLPSITPGLVMTPQFGSPVFYLRGVGTDDISASSEPSVSTYVDGVYIADLPATMFSFNNIDRIEVLDGPQGTLFGRNATGGLIQIITRAPSATPSLDASVGYSSYDTVQTQFYGTTGVTDNLSVDFAAQFLNQGVGWGKNIYDGTDIYKQQNYALRSKQLYEVDSATRIVVAEDYSSVSSSLSAGREPIPGALGAGATPYTGKFYDVNENFDPYDTFAGGGVSITATRDFEWATLKSISAFRQNKEVINSDQDSTPLNSALNFLPYHNREFSQELQLQSLQDSVLQWTAGLYLLNLYDTANIVELGTSQAAVGGSTKINALQTTQSYAGYAQGTYPIFTHTNLTAGLRFTEDNKEFFGEDITPNSGTFNVTNKDKGWGHWSYRFGIDQQLDESVLAYVSYSEGFKSGKFNLASPTNPPVNPETLVDYEGGVKSDLWDNRLRLNASGFYYDYSNIQITQRTVGGVQQLLNAAKATVYGLDAQTVIEPFEAFLLRGNMELLHGRYDDFPNAPTQIPSPAVCTPTPHSTGVPTGGTTTCTINAAGFPILRAPNVTFDVGANYSWPTSYGRMSADVGYNYTSGFFEQPDEQLEVPAYGLLNAQLSMSMDDGRYVVRLWGKNLTSTKYYAYLTTSVGDMETPGAPQTIGLTLEIHD